MEATNSTRVAGRDRLGTRGPLHQDSTCQPPAIGSVACEPQETYNWIVSAAMMCSGLSWGLLGGRRATSESNRKTSVGYKAKLTLHSVGMDFGVPLT
jgi:hypothetical protein